MDANNAQNRWICTVNLDNAQQSYARCLQLVLWLEKIAQNEVYEDLPFPEEFHPFYISRAGHLNTLNRNALLAQEQLLDENDSKRCSKITSSEMLLEGLKKEPKENQFSYYFRIQLNEGESDITELQYLVLLLQTVPAIRDRVAVRFMKAEQESWSTDDYFRVSHFLRFIQKRHRCFYACYNEQIGSLQMLSQAAEGVQSTFLPLLEIDGQLCQILNKTWLLDEEYSDQRFDKLYTAITPRGCDQSDITWMLFQIGLRMLFANLSGKKFRSLKSKQALVSFLCGLVQEMQGITPLDMLLFGALAGGKMNEKLEQNTMKAYMGNIQMFSLAISQILENTVNHSEQNRGVFTFRLQGNVEYLNTHYPDYPLSEKKMCLELMIADSNHNDGIVDHFLKSSKADTLIKNQAKDIRLAHLFGDFQDREMKKIWDAARQNRPEMCHGLLSFFACVRKFSGAIRVRSVPLFKSTTDRDIYYYNGTGHGNYSDVFLNGMYLPGTQFSIVVNRPISSSILDSEENNEDWAFDFDKLVYATTYKELAQALCFDEKVHDLPVHEGPFPSKLSLNSQEEKDMAVLEWKAWFDEKSTKTDGAHHVVYQCDLGSFCKQLTEHPALGEPFCKGFLSSRFFKPGESGKDEVYYCILFRNFSPQFSRIFAGTLRVMAQQESFALLNICVYFYPTQYKGDYLPYCATTLHDLLKRPLNAAVFPNIFPYTLFLRDESGHTLFEQELLKQACTPIYNTEQGFKIPDTHMRLGNKVHLDSFYEMALFFENPNCAYYTAFLILRSLLKHHTQIIDAKHHLLLYGYASYSRAIIWAIIQTLSSYRQLQKLDSFPEMAFVIYQNDLKLESEAPQVQMYYSRSEWQKSPNKIWGPQDTTLVMVVPISSSLTTFNKMKAELCRETGKEFCTVENFTAFWVRNHFKDEKAATDEERHFWQDADPIEKTIKSDLVQGTIHYLVSVTSEWSNPLLCQRCFPPDVLFEYPLVETDPTSTIPTQQFYLKPPGKSPASPEDMSENDARVARLKRNTIYGHISKGNNHYQYYVKTRVYFQQEREEIAAWLKKLRRQAVERGEPLVTSPTCINVLIIPQQVDNVEFSQYVYEYYFQGSAECVIINTEKEFRSNLCAEYSGLFRRLQAVKDPETNIKFHYIDISIRSGSSFNRAMSLVSSCLELPIQKTQSSEKNHRYEFQLEQVFLLVSRMSEASKKMYVKDPEKNYHAYVELHISAIRTFGDSCVPCKVQREALQYYKKAATKSISAYWEKKLYDRACVPFDKFDEHMDEGAVQRQEEGYQRMVCSHRAANYIRPIQGADIPIYFSAIRNFLEELRMTASFAQEEGEPAKSTGIYKELTDDNRKEWLSAGLKILVRPFFTFDYKLRCVVMDLLLLLSEFLIKRCTIDSMRARLSKQNGQLSKKYLLENGHLEWIKLFADDLLSVAGSGLFQQLEFIRDNILKGLADIKSNYVLRLDTMVQISCRLSEAKSACGLKEKTIAEFYEHYLRSILRMTHSSSDETKGVWLEYLLQFATEYQKEIPAAPVHGGIEQLVSKVPENIQGQFRDFLEILLVENNRPIYQAVEEFNKQKEQNIRAITLEGFLGEYHIRNAAKFLSFGCNVGTTQQLDPLRNLLQLGQDRSDYKNRYQSLGRDLQNIVRLETGEGKSVILFGKNAKKESPTARYLNLPDYFTLFPIHFKGERDWEKTSEQIDFERQWKQVENTPYIQDALKKNGFFLMETAAGSATFNIIIMLDNNYDDLTNNLNHTREHELTIPKIEPIYIYIPCALQRQKALGLTRKILMFRRKLIEWLEKDFNNNAIAVLSQKQHIAKLLSTDKMGDHAENDFVECQQKLLLATNEAAFYAELKTGNWEYAVNKMGRRENLYELRGNEKPPLHGHLTDNREWFFLRSYVNSRISRLFRTMVREENELEESEIINSENYYARDGQSILMRPVYDLKAVFFTPIKVGYIRKNYLEQMMKVIAFRIEGKMDYGENGDAKIDERLQNLSDLFDTFQCIDLRSAKDERRYAYLSEYLAVILLDCFISGLKAGEVWNQVRWGGEAYYELASKKASEKCVIELFREQGSLFEDTEFDYLVIRNKIYHPLRSEKKGPGMSQAAIRWYIEGLWRSCAKTKEGFPEVVTKKTEDEYIIKLPILKRGDAT